MKLGFDIDGITANMAQAMVDFINKTFGLDYDVTVFVDHNVHNNLYVDDPEESEEIAMAMRTNIIENPDAMADIAVYEDAIDAIRVLSRHHSIHHVTSRPANQKAATVDWLRKNHIPFDSVHVIGVNGRDGNNKSSKGRIGRALNLDFFIDDCAFHLEDMYRYKNRWRKGLALFTQPWNLNEPADFSKINRFDKWEEVIRHIGIQKR